MRRRNRRKKINIIFLLIMMVLIARVGYSALLSNLKVNGTSSVSTISWDVHFENVAATASSNVTPTTAPSAPPSSKVTTLTYAVTFENPGDVYEFTVNVKNGGTIDAKLATNPTLTGISPEQDVYTNYTVTYSDGKPIRVGDVIKSGESRKIKVLVEIERDLSVSQLPTTQQVLNLGVDLDYIQAD